MTALDAKKKFSFTVEIDGHQPADYNCAATVGDTLELTHNFIDRQGNTIDVTGATATLRLAPKGSGWGRNTAEKTQTDGITVSGTKTVSTIDADDVSTPGVYSYQLRLTKSGSAVVIAQGDIDLATLIE